MIDYKGLEALATIIESNSFEMASRKLCITQPAISQRFGMRVL
jgi:DNA-binding transcriptional LysR family regulator